MNTIILRVTFKLFKTLACLFFSLFTSLAVAQLNMAAPKVNPELNIPYPATSYPLDAKTRSLIKRG